MPSIKSLMIESYDTFKRTLGSQVLLYLIQFGVGLLSLIVLGLSLYKHVGLFTNFDLLSTTISSPDGLISVLKSMIGVSVFLLFFSILVGVIMTAINLAKIYIVGKAEEKTTVGIAIKMSLESLFAVILMGVFSSILVFGGFMFFGVPGLLMVLFFGFLPFEILIGGKRGMQSLIGSARIISSNFGEIFTRYVIFWVMSSIVYFVLGKLSIFNFNPSSFELSFNGLYSLPLTLLMGFFWSVYSLSFTVTLYKHAKMATDENKKISTSWIWVTSLMGYVLIGFYVIFALKVIPEVMNNAKTSLETIDSIETSSGLNVDSTWSEEYRSNIENQINWYIENNDSGQYDLVIKQMTDMLDVLNNE